jgi:3-oxoacyl-[acyl-carrier-protein] synthase-3
MGRKFIDDALVRNEEKIDSYQCVLPHLSSFFFRRKMERILSELSADADHPVPYWTNLATAGNTGAASIFIMLDHFTKSRRNNHGDRILLFIPESGQFNFVLISLTAIVV